MNVIRWGTPIYIMVCLTISINIQAQESTALLQKQVRITNTLLSIDSLSRLITAQTGVFLSFNSNKVEAGKKITTRKRLYAVSELVELIKSNTGSDYKIYKDHVIFHGGDKIKGTTAGSLRQTPSNQAAAKRESSAGNHKNKAFLDKSSQSSTKSATTVEIKKATSSQLPTTTAEIKRPNTAKSNQSPGTTETQIKSTSLTENIAPSTQTQVTTEKSPFPLEPLKASPPMPKPSITLLFKPALTTRQPSISPQRTRWFADAGVTVDDVLYLNTYITAGHKFLHGFFSWSSSFKVSGFRYGLGSMIPLNDDWRVGLMVTTGKLNRDVNFSGVRDTLKNVMVKSDLHRLAIQVEKSIRPNLIVKAGPVFNLLKSSYYQEGTPVTIATSGYEGTNGDREIYSVKPLYTLSNSYKDTESSNTKTWIGFQVSLCYRFNF